MLSSEELRSALRRIDGRSYKAYKDLKDVYDFGRFALAIEHVQGDPFASPSRLVLNVPQSLAEFPSESFSTKSREIALRDLLTRHFHSACKRYSRGGRGTGKSGQITIDRPGQEVLERTSCFIDEERVIIRFTAGLPAFGRRVAGRHCEEMFFEEVPRMVDDALRHGSLDHKNVMEHVETAEDADHLRSSLDDEGLVAFVADGSVLPRRSGIDDRPMKGEDVVPFSSPDSMRTELELPNAGSITGMGIKKGITLIVGGGYHGKSTLLKAIELGIYNHIPGDGREFVVTDPNAVKIRAEDGRRIEKVDISPFIGNLPFGKDTTSFSTDDASGSTSQASNIIEALETGASTLLIDEDTSATNFMIRDHRMQELVSKAHEPITPFIDKVGQLHVEHGVSTVLVIGGSGDYFDVADRVICMVEYLPRDVTEDANTIAEKYKAERTVEGGPRFGSILERIPMHGSIDPSKGKRDVKITARGMSRISFGTHEIDLSSIEQIVHPSQTRAIGDAIQYSKKYMDGERTILGIVDSVISDIDSKGLDILSPYRTGGYARFRRSELASAINRLRTLKVEKAGR